jgi:hypothetical protein
LGEQRRASFTSFFDYWVFPHVLHLAISSCGVQMTGGS